MDLYVMKYVVNVAECGNFSLASQACHIGQPALSQQISKLEKELGVQLFIRHPRGVTLTDAGREFVRRSHEILAASNALEAEMSSYSGVNRGTLTIGLITSLQCIEFGDMLAAFVRENPQISVNIRQDGTYPLIDQVRERKLDIAFVNRPLTDLPTGIEFKKLGEDRYDLAVAYDHPLAYRDEVSMDELKDERFIFHQTWQVASGLCLNACRAAGFDPIIACRSGTPTTVIYMVQGGMGIALLPTEEFKGRKLDGIHRIHVKEDIIKEVGVVWNRNANSTLVDAAVKFASEWSLSI